MSDDSRVRADWISFTKYLLGCFSLRIALFWRCKLFHLRQGMSSDPDHPLFPQSYKHKTFAQALIGNGQQRATQARARRQMCAHTPTRTWARAAHVLPLPQSACHARSQNEPHSGVKVYGLRCTVEPCTPIVFVFKIMIILSWDWPSPLLPQEKKNTERHV